jgi:hypothetical protein
MWGASDQPRPKGGRMPLAQAPEAARMPDATIGNAVRVAHSTKLVGMASFGDGAAVRDMFTPIPAPTLSPIAVIA